MKIARCLHWTCPWTLALLLALALFGCSASRAADGWVDTRLAEPFICRADFSLQGLEPFLDELAELQDELVRVLGVSPAQERIEIYLFRNETVYRNFLATHFADVPYRRALYIKRGGPGIVLAYVSKQLPTDLRHECTHAMLHAVLPMVPLWLDEGLAELFEMPAAKRAFGSPHLARIRWNNRFGVKTSIGKLEKNAGVADMGETDYRDAWAWVHFMLYGPPEGHSELVLFLRDIAAGVPPGSLGQRLARRLPDLDRRYTAHFRGWMRKR